MFQAVVGVAYVAIAALAGAMVAAAWMVTGALTIRLVGGFVVPVAFGLTLVAAVDLLWPPVLALAYAVRGTYLTYQGLDFDCPLVGALAAGALPRPAKAASLG